MAQKPLENDRENLKPKKFMMWLFLVSSVIFFAGLTSGFIVYTAGDPSRGINTILPDVFMYSAGLIILSSITMHLAYGAGKQLKYKLQNIYLVSTIVLGLIFFYLQVEGWGILFDRGVVFSGNPNASQSFIYVFIASHLLHIVVGIIMLLRAINFNIMKIAPVRNIFRLELTSIFWHFIDILWIYLYVFLLLNQ